MTREQEMKLIDQLQDQAYEDFKNNHTVMYSLEIPESFIRMCFFGGYFAALDDLEKLMPNEHRQTQGSM